MDAFTAILGFLLLWTLADCRKELVEFLRAWLLAGARLAGNSVRLRPDPPALRFEEPR